MDDVKTLTAEIERLRFVIKEMLIKSEYQQGWSAGYDAGVNDVDCRLRSEHRALTERLIETETNNVVYLEKK